MLKKDFIIRQFEEFGKVLALILGFKLQNDWEKFEKEIANAAQKFTPYEINDVEQMSIETFNERVIQNEKLNPEQIKILADLLFEKMNYFLSLGNDNKFSDLKNKCILLYKKYTEELTQNEFNLDTHFKLDYLNKI